MPLSYLIPLLLVVFFIYMEGVKGGTPGKLMLGLKVVNEQNSLIGIPKAILRYVGKIISMLILGIGFIMIAFTEKKQGLHDKIANTYVIREKETKGLFITGLVLGLLIVVAFIFVIILYGGILFLLLSRGQIGNV